MHTEDTPHIVGWYRAEATFSRWEDVGYVWSDQWTPGEPTSSTYDTGDGDYITRTIYPCSEEEAEEAIDIWGR